VTIYKYTQDAIRHYSPFGGLFTGGRQHSIWNPLSQASQNSMLSWKKGKPNMYWPLTDWSHALLMPTNLICFMCVLWAVYAAIAHQSVDP